MSEMRMRTRSTRKLRREVVIGRRYRRRVRKGLSFFNPLTTMALLFLPAAECARVRVSGVRVHRTAEHFPRCLR